MMAVYNQRINTQLMDKCHGVSKALLEKETHSFFPNIITYWNHILFGDLILLGRLASNEIGSLSTKELASFPKPQSPQDIYCNNISELALVRTQVDELIIQFCAALNEEDCEKFITYTTTEGDEITKVVADVIQHLFNHQTHHRGQLTCVLSQFGIDYGCIDLPMVVPEGSHSNEHHC